MIECACVSHIRNQIYGPNAMKCVILFRCDNNLNRSEFFSIEFTYKKHCHNHNADESMPNGNNARAMSAHTYTHTARQQCKQNAKMDEKRKKRTNGIEYIVCKLCPHVVYSMLYVFVRMCVYVLWSVEFCVLNLIGSI